jgi:hypothetical protein
MAGKKMQKESPERLQPKRTAAPGTASRYYTSPALMNRKIGALIAAGGVCRSIQLCDEAEHPTAAQRCTRSRRTK